MLFPIQPKYFLFDTGSTSFPHLARWNTISINQLEWASLFDLFTQSSVKRLNQEDREEVEYTGSLFWPRQRWVRVQVGAKKAHPKRSRSSEVYSGWEFKRCLMVSCSCSFRVIVSRAPNALEPWVYTFTFCDEAIAFVYETNDIAIFYEFHLAVRNIHEKEYIQWRLPACLGSANVWIPDTSRDSNIRRPTITIRLAL